MTTSTVTLLFTDIVDSTRLWEAYPEAMKAALSRHDEILRAAVTAHGGHIVVGTGDGVYAAFPSALGAVDAVIDAQQRLLTEPWPTFMPLRVRMGLHTGEAEMSGDDPKGPAANRAARLMALAAGGQILLSQATADLVQDRLPAGAALRDLGEHDLRGLARPERICQLTAPGLLGDFPPLRSSAFRPNNLPTALTPFIGRDRELIEVSGLLDRTRLLTLTGPGGMGKTRLALQVAADRLDAYLDGAWLVELAPITDPAFLVSAIGGALRVMEQPGRSLDAALADYLRHKQLLVILDNCEHLIDACARHADELLRAAPGLMILATSREMLGVAGETAYRVPSLGLPATDIPDLEVVRRSEAAQFFISRAQAAQPGFTLNEETAPVIAEICRRLDGIPLAIELAAARTRVMGVADIAVRLDDRFRLLTGGSRAALPRQQTLRALVDWSWDLLTGPERKLLRRLSTFAGGWTLADAEAICADPPHVDPVADVVDEFDVLDLLASLVDKSLAVNDSGPGGATRYRLLETIRQYARDRLLEAGEAEGIRARHATHFLSLAETAGPALKGPDLVLWFRRLKPELDNFRSALEWYLEWDPEAGLRLVSGLEMYWVFMGGVLSESESWLARLLKRAGPLPDLDLVKPERVALYARAVAVQGRISQAFGNTEQTIRLAETAAALARNAGDQGTLAMALSLICFSAGMMGDFALAEERGRDVLNLSSDGRYAWDRVNALVGLEQASIVGRHDTATGWGYHEEIERLSRALGNPFMKAQVEFGAGMIEGFAGNLAAATRHLRESNRLFSELGLTLFVDTTRSELAHLLRRHGDLDGARAHYRETIRAWQTSGSILPVAHMLESFAYLSVAEGQPERAARLLGAGTALREPTGIDMLPHERAEYDGAIEALRSALGVDLFRATLAAGRALDMNAAVAYAVE